MNRNDTILSGALYVEMVRGGAGNLANNRSVVNNLNVFPVPDGDTGSNMSMTMGVIREKAGSLPDKLSDCAAQISLQESWPKECFWVPEATPA